MSTFNGAVTVLKTKRLVYVLGGALLVANELWNVAAFRDLRESYVQVLLAIAEEGSSISSALDCTKSDRSSSEQLGCLRTVGMTSRSALPKVVALAGLEEVANGTPALRAEAVEVADGVVARLARPSPYKAALDAVATAVNNSSPVSVGGLIARYQMTKLEGIKQTEADAVMEARVFFYRIHHPQSGELYSRLLAEGARIQ